MQTGDAGDFIEFGTLAEEIKSLRLVPGGFPYLCMNKIYMGSFPWERKKKKSPFVVMVGVAYIECATSTSLKLHK